MFLFINRQFTDDQVWCVLGSSKPNFPIQLCNIKKMHILN